MTLYYYSKVGGPFNGAQGAAHSFHTEGRCMDYEPVALVTVHLAFRTQLAS